MSSRYTLLVFGNSQTGGLGSVRVNASQLPLGENEPGASSWPATVGVSCRRPLPVGCTVHMLAVIPSVCLGTDTQK